MDEGQHDRLHNTDDAAFYIEIQDDISKAFGGGYVWSTEHRGSFLEIQSASAHVQHLLDLWPSSEAHLATYYPNIIEQD